MDRNVEFGKKHSRQIPFSAISEAAAGGANEAIKFLLNGGADPNTIGHFGRTPLYRAVFAGHIDTIKILLEAGADPRIKATDLNQPAQITSDPTILGQGLTSEFQVNFYP